MRITSKGQVTIPHETRNRLRLSAGSEVEFKVLPDGNACPTRVEFLRTVRLD